MLLVIDGNANQVQSRRHRASPRESADVGIDWVKIAVWEYWAMYLYRCSRVNLQKVDSICGYGFSYG